MTTIQKDIASKKTIKEVEEIRNMVNELCDKRISYIENVNRAYGLSNNSFGFIKETFENMSPVLFTSESGRKIMSKYAKTIKESKTLSSMHLLYENLRKINKNGDIDFFINGISNHNWNINESELKTDTKKIGKILAEAYMTIGSDAENYIKDENTKLNGAVEYIAKNKANAGNLYEYSNAVKIIRENILNKEVDVDSDFQSTDSNIDDIVDEMREKFNKKYDGQLTEDEMEMIRELSKGNGEDTFNKYKDECSTKLSEAKEKFISDGDSKSAEKMDTIMEQISKKSYSSDTLISDITNLIELKSIFD